MVGDRHHIRTGEGMLTTITSTDSYVDNPHFFSSEGFQSKPAQHQAHMTRTKLA
jgi:hypothetical protein